jgi:hypothetical protein
VPLSFSAILSFKFSRSLNLPGAQETRELIDAASKYVEPPENVPPYAASKINSGELSKLRALVACNTRFSQTFRLSSYCTENLLSVVITTFLWTLVAVGVISTDHKGAIDSVMDALRAVHSEVRLACAFELLSTAFFAATDNYVGSDAFFTFFNARYEALYCKIAAAPVPGAKTSTVGAGKGGNHIKNNYNNQNQGGGGTNANAHTLNQTALQTGGNAGANNSVAIAASGSGTPPPPLAATKKKLASITNVRGESVTLPVGFCWGFLRGKCNKPNCNAGKHGLPDGWSSGDFPNVV